VHGGVAGREEDRLPCLALWQGEVVDVSFEVQRLYVFIGELPRCFKPFWSDFRSTVNPLKLVQTIESLRPAVVHVVTADPNILDKVILNRQFVVDSNEYVSSGKCLESFVHVEPSVVEDLQPADGAYVLLFRGYGDLYAVTEYLNQAVEKGLRLCIEIDRSREDGDYLKELWVLYNLVYSYKEAYGVDVTVRDVSYLSFENVVRGEKVIQSDFPRPPIQASIVGVMDGGSVVHEVWGCLHGVVFRHSREGSMEIRRFGNYIQCPAWRNPRNDPTLLLLERLRELEGF